MANIPFTKLEIPNGADSYVFDGITVDDLTELDLTQFPKQAQIDEFNNRINDEYVKKTELDELDLTKFPDKDQINAFNETVKTQDYVKRPELTKLDLSQFPDKTQIDAFNENLKLEDYVKRAELTPLDLSLFPSKDEITVINTKIDNFNNLEFVEFDYDALMARLDNIVARIEAIEAKVGI